MTISEYKIAKGWKVFMIIMGPMLALLFLLPIAMPFIPALRDEQIMKYYWAITPVCLILTGFILAGVWDMFVYTVVVDDESITVIDIRGRRSLRFDEAIGYKENDKFIKIVPADKRNKKITVSGYPYLVNSGGLLLQIKEHLADLDAISAAEEEQAILANEDYGISEESRSEKLSKAKKVSRILNGIGVAVGVWSFIFPRPYEIVMVAGILVFVVTVLVIKFSKNLIRLSEDKASAYPSVVIALAGATFALIGRVLLDFELYDYRAAWKLTLIVALVVIAVLMVGSKEMAFNKASGYGMILVTILLSLGFSYGSLVFFNCYYDAQQAQEYGAKVTGKYISSGKATTRHLKLTAWGNKEDNEPVTVSKTMYDNTGEGDSVTVYLHSGRLGISWFDVAQRGQ